MTLNLQIEIENRMRLQQKDDIKWILNCNFFKKRKLLKFSGWMVQSRPMKNFESLKNFVSLVATTPLACLACRFPSFYENPSSALHCTTLHCTALLYNQKTKLCGAEMLEMSQKQDQDGTRVLIGRKVSEFPSTSPVLTLVLGEI